MLEGGYEIADASDRATEFGRLITSVNKNSYDFCDRRSNIVRVRWLEPRPPVAEHRISRQGPKQSENCRKKGVVRREHYRRADNNCAREGDLHGRLAFAPAANIRRWRARIGAES